MQDVPTTISKSFLFFFWSLKSRLIIWTEINSPGLLHITYDFLLCLFLWQYWQSFMTVIHRKLLLKVSSDAAAVPKAINVFAIWCWVWVSHFLLLDLITLLYVDNQLNSLNQFLKCFMKSWRSKSFISAVYMISVSVVQDKSSAKQNDILII